MTCSYEFVGLHLHSSLRFIRLLNSILFQSDSAGWTWETCFKAVWLIKRDYIGAEAVKSSHSRDRRENTANVPPKECVIFCNFSAPWVVLHNEEEETLTSCHDCNEGRLVEFSLVSWKTLHKRQSPQVDAKSTHRTWHDCRLNSCLIQGFLNSYFSNFPNNSKVFIALSPRSDGLSAYMVSSRRRRSPLQNHRGQINLGWWHDFWPRVTPVRKTFWQCLA